jgi:hypothetical protein
MYHVHVAQRARQSYLARDRFTVRAQSALTHHRRAAPPTFDAHTIFHICNIDERSGCSQLLHDVHVSSCRQHGGVMTVLGRDAE